MQDAALRPQGWAIDVADTNAKIRLRNTYGQASIWYETDELVPTAQPNELSCYQDTAIYLGTTCV